VAHETVASYANRLRSANSISELTWAVWTKPMLRQSELQPEEAHAQLLEVLGGLRPGTLTSWPAPFATHEDGDTCVRCSTGLDMRFACTRCTTEPAQQRPHDGPRVCKRHMRWMGPGATPDQQLTVGASVLRADRHYRRMRREGVLDAHGLAELLGCVEAWAEAEVAEGVTAAERFRVAVDIAACLFRGGRMTVIVDETVPAETRHRKLRRVVETVVAPRSSAVLADAVWLLLRTTSFAPAGVTHRFHGFVRVLQVNDDTEVQQMRTCAFPRKKQNHMLQFVFSEREGTRYDKALKRDKAPRSYVCSLGHRYNSSADVIVNAKDSGGCPYCARKLLLPGFNTFADTHPAMAAQWHETLNGALTPSDVFAGSGDKVHWRCAVGHEFQQSLNNRTSKGVGCPVCSNFEIRADVNSISALCPDLARQWDRERNGARTPETVGVGSEYRAWWICQDGHGPYQMMVSRRAVGGGCQYCSRQKVHPDTSIVATHPSVAARFHPTRNGKLRPTELLSGSGLTVWWKCADRGHSYRSTVSRQTTGTGCNVCSNKVVTKRNCMRKTHPLLASQFHPTKNGDLTPDEVIAGCGKPLWWLCELGHDWQAEGHVRVHQGTGCPYCSNARVWVGFNDLPTTHPWLLSEFDHEKNAPLLPTGIIAGTSRRIWWKCERHGSWPAKGADRVKGSGCKDCSLERRRARPDTSGGQLAKRAETNRVAVDAVADV
jgi:hypothetical protein